MPSLRRGRVLVKNWHDFERKGMSAGSRVQKNGVAVVERATIKIGAKTTSGRGGRYFTAQAFDIAVDSGQFRVLDDKRPEKQEVIVEETRYVESDARLMQRLLGREIGGKQNILVFNDEAHHAYRIRGASVADAEFDAGSLDEEREDELERESTIWVDGLDRIHRNRRINFCVDLSATPYFLQRAGEDTNKVFPWVVSDFGLTDAIESGLVKIPQLAVADTTGADQAAYFNIWRWIMSKLTSAERGGKRANPKPEAVLKWAAPPIELLGGQWEQLRRDWDEDSDEDRPPVFILVCKNTKLAATLYAWLAEGTPRRVCRRRIYRACGTPMITATRFGSTRRSSQTQKSKAPRTTSPVGCASRSIPSASATGRGTSKGVRSIPRASRSWRRSSDVRCTHRVVTFAASSASGCSLKAGTATRSRTSWACVRSCRSCSASRSLAAVFVGRAMT
jgi:hypothetical protein